MPNAPKPPQTKAAALRYNQESDAAPILTAKGRGQVAERILEVAREHNIPIRSDADLVEILEKVEIDQEIPLEVYTVVAEIFSYLYKVNQRKAQQ
ncbi:MAG: EscU/YscU/HrcU family type III secretion system export apparatus switch protein [Pseudomonadaceae bacterium]|nr:EscU/YscU/HrcU family type III secretion system export apparatus switch protein [Pseudomonadaceae bacterium]